MLIKLVKKTLFAGFGLFLGIGPSQFSLSGDTSELRIQIKGTIAVFSAPSPRAQILIAPGGRGEASVDLVDASPDETGRQWILVQFEDHAQGWVVVDGLKQEVSNEQPPVLISESEQIASPAVTPEVISPRRMLDRPYVDPRSEKAFVTPKPVRSTWLQGSLLSLRRYFSR